MSFNTLSYYWREALSSISRNSWLSVASVGTVAVSLMIVGIFALLAVNANEFTRGLESGLEIRAILKDGQNRDSIKKIQGDIQKIQGVSMVDFISKDQALEEMRKNLQNRKEILDGLQSDNPLPDAFRIKAASADLIPGLAARLEKVGGVDQVVYGHGLVERLISATRWARIACAVILGILCLAAVFLISTTIRMSVFARRKEIGIMVLLGATNWFVRFPYLLEGMILGLLGALLAGSLVYLGYMSAVNYIDQTLPFINPVTNRQTIMVVLGSVLGTGLLIGALGSIFSIRKYLKI